MPNDAQPQSKSVVTQPTDKPFKPNRYQFQYKTLLNPKRKVKFLQELARIGNATVAGERVKVSRAFLYHERDRDPDFAKAWEEALQIAADRAEFKLQVRAFDGTDKPLTYKGQITLGPDGKPVTVKEYSDTLAMFIMRGMKPDKYRDQTNVNVSGTLTLEALVGASMAPTEPEPGPVIDHEPEE